MITMKTLAELRPGDRLIISRGRREPVAVSGRVASVEPPEGDDPLTTVAEEDGGHYLLHESAGPFLVWRETP